MQLQLSSAEIETKKFVESFVGKSISKIYRFLYFEAGELSENGSIIFEFKDQASLYLDVAFDGTHIIAMNDTCNGYIMEDELNPNSGIEYTEIAKINMSTKIKYIDLIGLELKKATPLSYLNYGLCGFELHVNSFVVYIISALDECFVLFEDLGIFKDYISYLVAL